MPLLNDSYFPCLQVPSMLNCFLKNVKVRFRLDWLGKSSPLDYGRQLWSASGKARLRTGAPPTQSQIAFEFSRILTNIFTEVVRCELVSWRLKDGCSCFWRSPFSWMKHRNLNFICLLHGGKVLNFFACSILRKKFSGSGCILVFEENLPPARVVTVSAHEVHFLIHS